MRKVTAADRGLVEMPVLAPHIEFRLIGAGRSLLVSESFNTLLRGRIHGDLLPLLDGNRSQSDLVAALASSYSAQEVRSALVSLADRGYVVSGEHAMERGPAAFWSSLGCSPRWSEERLRASRVAVTGDDGHLAGQLRTIGVVVDADRPTLSVIVCEDYLDDRHDAVNRRCIASGAPWMLVRPKGMQPLFGPVFRPTESGPCWKCLAYRQRGHQEVSGANSLSGVVAHELSGLMGTEEVPHDQDTSATGDPADEIQGSLRRMAGTTADAGGGGAVAGGV